MSDKLDKYEQWFENHAKEFIPAENQNALREKLIQAAENARAVDYDVAYPQQRDMEMEFLKSELALYKEYFGKAAKEIPAFKEYA